MALLLHVASMIKWCEKKSLIEHCTTDVLSKLKKVEKLKTQTDPYSFPAAVLVAFTEALKDAEKAVKVDPKFGLSPKEPHSVRNEGVHQGQGNEGTRLISPASTGIMGDPVLQQILQQAQKEPGTLQDHMKNLIIRSNIQKLIAAITQQHSRRGRWQMAARRV